MPIKIYTKLIAVLLIVSLFLVVTTVLRLTIRDSGKRTTFCLRIASAFARLILAILGVRVKADTGGLRPGENYLIVSNHLSYLDTLIIFSRIGAVFIASVDGHQEQFPIGLITKNSGGIFVERKSRKKLKEDLGKIDRTLLNGFNVVLFPEGTTSDGGGLLPFKSSFLYSAQSTGTKVLPLCINYRKLDSSPIDSENKNTVFFYEDISLIKHFMRFLTVSEVEVSVDTAPIVSCADFSGRKELSVHISREISKLFEPK